MAKKKSLLESIGFAPEQKDPDDAEFVPLTSEMIEESIPEEFKVQDNTIVPELDSSDLASHSKFDKFRK